MTTLVPRPPYTQDEIDQLYPKRVKLQLVQVVRAPHPCRDTILLFWEDL